MSCSYFSATTFRFTFSVGVSSPPSWERSAGRISNFFTCSTRANFWLISSTWRWIVSRIPGFFASAAGSASHPFSWASFAASSMSRVTSAVRNGLRSPITTHWEM